jgi:hypothetical protein
MIMWGRALAGRAGLVGQAGLAMCPDEVELD